MGDSPDPKQFRDLIQAVRKIPITFLIAFEELAQNGPGVKRAARRSCEPLSCLAARIRALCASLAAASLALCSQPDVQDMVKRSVEANQRDFEAAVSYNNKERDRTSAGSRTYQITMIEGTPYQRLIALDGKPLSPAQQAEEQKKEQQAREQRKAESPAERQKRNQKYARERSRDNALMQQLTEAFTFVLASEHRVRGFSVYALKAAPKPGYKPPNMDCQVLPGMQGELWIDQKTYQWVKVTAQVIRPVSIEGFLARVEPGTRFELDKSPVGDGSIWLASHFSERASARILGMFNRNSWEDDTFWDYQPVK